MAKSKVTIENLAGMLQRGFSTMEKEFADIKEWQRLADGKFDVLENELLSIKKDLQNVIDRREFEVLKERVQRLEKVLLVIKKK